MVMGLLVDILVNHFSCKSVFGRDSHVFDYVQGNPEFDSVLTTVFVKKDNNDDGISIVVALLQFTNWGLRIHPIAARAHVNSSRRLMNDHPLCLCG